MTTSEYTWGIGSMGIEDNMIDEWFVVTKNGEHVISLVPRSIAIKYVWEHIERPETVWYNGYTWDYDKWIKDMRQGR